MIPMSKLSHVVSEKYWCSAAKNATLFENHKKLECLSALCRAHIMFKEISEKSHIRIVPETVISDIVCAGGPKNHLLPCAGQI